MRLARSYKCRRKVIGVDACMVARMAGLEDEMRPSKKTRR